MAILDVLSQQLLKTMTAFGEHSYSEPSDFPAKDPEGNVLPHEHTVPKEFHKEHLPPYAQEFVDEGTKNKAVRWLNTMQNFKGRV